MMDTIKKIWEDIRVGDIIIAQLDYDGCDITKCFSAQVTSISERYVDVLNRYCVTFEVQYPGGKEVTMKNVPINDDWYHHIGDAKYFYPSIEAAIYYNF